MARVVPSGALAAALSHARAGGITGVHVRLARNQSLAVASEEGGVWVLGRAVLQRCV